MWVGSMFDKELFLQIAKEMGIEVEELSENNKDMANGTDIDIKEVIDEIFNASIEDLMGEYNENNKEWCTT